MKKSLKVFLLMFALITFMGTNALANDSTSNDTEGLGVRCSITDQLINVSAFKTKNPYVYVAVVNAKYRFASGGKYTKPAPERGGTSYFSYSISNAGPDATRWYSCRGYAKLPTKQIIYTRTIYN